MKIVHLQIKLVGVNKGKAVFIKPLTDNDPLQNTYTGEHELSLSVSDNYLYDDDYSLEPIEKGCRININKGDKKREYGFILDEDFVKELEKFLENYISEQIKKIPNDFKENNKGGF